MSLRHLPWIAFVLSALALIGFMSIWSIPDRGKSVVNTPSEKRIAVLVHCAPALRPPVEKAAAEFERDFGIRIQPQFQASEALLTTLRITRQGDLFLPADESYVTSARALDLVEPTDYALARMTAVAVVRPEFDADRFTWDDLLCEGFRLVQPSSASAIGALTERRLTETGQWQRIKGAQPAMVGSVTEAANAVKLGSADGAIIWDAVAAQYPTLKVVKLPGLERITANVTAAVCTNATARTEARWFAEYLAGPGRSHFAAAGYAPPSVADEKGPPK